MFYICAVKHSKIKQHIIETASELFYRNGYNSTGINEIIAESGIAKATLYNHFRTKDDICLAYLQHKDATFIHDIQEFCKSKRKGKARVLGIFDFLQVFFQDKDFNGCWCIKTVSEIPKDDEKIRNEIQSQKKRFIQVITDLVRDNIKDVTDKKAATIARQMYLLYESAVAESHLHQADWPISDTKKIANQLLQS